MGLTEYECPACGGAMEFSAQAQMLSCPFCDTKIKVADYKAPRKEEQDKDAKADSNGWKPEELSGMVVYSCQSCGGEIIASENEGSLTCPFCSNNVVVKEKFSGDLRPDYVIPFKHDKKEAMKAYEKYVSGKLLLPKVFYERNHIDKIRGIYIPYWLFDGTVDADYTFDATRVRCWSDSSYDYTETKHYSVTRAGTESFTKVPHDASKEMPDDLMESIEPFDFKEAVPFNGGYLAGYLANRYDVEVSEAEPHAITRMKDSVDADIRSTVSNYDTAIARTSDQNARGISHKYALYPVWLLNTTFNGKPYLFAMNGQSGKFVGNLPVSVPKALALFFGSTTCATLVSILVWFIFLR